MSEFMGLIFGKYEAKVRQGFQSLFDSSKLSWVPCKNLENRIWNKNGSNSEGAGCFSSLFGVLK